MTKDTDQLDNIGYIQYLNRRILEEAEEHITGRLPGDAGEGVVPVRADDKDATPPTPAQLEVSAKRKVILNRRHRMWGIKNPIIWILEKIADTELKILKGRPPASVDAPPPMDEKDIAIVKDFLNKQ